MKHPSLNKSLTAAVRAARAAGELIHRNWRAPKRVDSTTRYDIKLELDVRSQKLIGTTLRHAFPQIPMLAEEGDSGDVQQEYRWVVDPIDGTVNFAHGIPHVSVSIALQRRCAPGRRQHVIDGTDYETVVGVIHDPFAGELWTAIRGRRARLNGRPIRVGNRRRLDECIITMGFAKGRQSLDDTLPLFNRLAYRVRKIRMMGSAALSLAYVASGRFDVYFESRVRLWDIAAGGLIVECAGGEFWHRHTGDTHSYRLIASNGRLRPKLEHLAR